MQLLFQETYIIALNGKKTLDWIKAFQVQFSLMYKT